MAFRIPVSSNAAEVSREMRFLFRDQLRFAASFAINLTAKGIQAEERAGLKERFTIRRAYVLQGVKISKFSTKRDLEAHIEIDPTRRFLLKFEEGGVTQPRGTSFAVPTTAAKRTKTGVLRRAQRPKALELKFHGRGSKAEVFRGKSRTFLIRRSDGSGAIFQRVGRPGSGKLRQLFSFTPEAQIDPDLEFELTARTVFQETFNRNFEFAFDRAVRSAR